MIEVIQALPLETIVNIVLFLTVMTAINYAYPLASSIVELLTELGKWQVQATLKDTPSPTTKEEK